MKKTILFLAFLMINIVHLLGEEHDEFKALDEITREISTAKSYIPDNIPNSPLSRPEKAKLPLDRLLATEDKLLNKYLLARLNGEYWKEGKTDFGNACDVLKSMNYFYPERGLDWIFDNYSQLNASGKFCIIVTFSYISYSREAYEMLMVLMDDKTSFKGTHFPVERVCNMAYWTMIIYPHARHMSLLTGYPHTRVEPDFYTPFEWWDKNIQMFMEWWKANSEEFLKDKKILYPNHTKFMEKCEKLREYIRKNPAEEYQWSEEEKHNQKKKLDFYNKVENMTGEEYQEYLFPQSERLKLKKENDKSQELLKKHLLEKLPQGYGVMGPHVCYKSSNNSRRYFMPGYNWGNKRNHTDETQMEEDLREYTKNFIGEDEFYPNGNICRVTLYKGGKKDGTEIEWYDNGQMESMIPYKDDLMDGHCQNWDKDGNLIGDYTMNMGTGVKKIFYPDGKIKEIKSYKNGEFDGIFKWFAPDGKVRKIVASKAGKFIFPSISFYENGNMEAFETRNVEGRLHGIILGLDIKGNISEVSYKLNGKDVSKEQYIEATKKDSNLPKYQENISKYKELIKIPPEYLAKE